MVAVGSNRGTASIENDAHPEQSETEFIVLAIFQKNNPALIWP